jgi:hypothetical protein
MWTIFTTRSAPSELVHIVDAKKDLVDDEDDDLHANGLGRRPFSIGHENGIILQRNRPDATNTNGVTSVLNSLLALYFNESSTKTENKLLADRLASLWRPARFIEV